MHVSVVALKAQSLNVCRVSQRILYCVWMGGAVSVRLPCSSFR